MSYPIIYNRNQARHFLLFALESCSNNIENYGATAPDYYPSPIALTFEQVTADEFLFHWNNKTLYVNRAAYRFATREARRRNIATMLANNPISIFDN